MIESAVQASVASALQSHVVTIDGFHYHYFEQGVGAPLLLLHGFPDHAAAWRPLFERLPMTLRLLAPDQRGYRQTRRPTSTDAYRIDLLVEDLVKLLDWWKVPQIHICGHDWGGLLGFELARQAPSRVASIVALNAAPLEILQRMIWHDPPQRKASQYIRRLRSPDADSVFHESAVETLIERFLGDARRQGILTDADISVYRDAWTQPNAWQSMLAWYRAAPLDVPDISAPAPALAEDYDGSEKIEHPVLLLWGDRDTIFVPRMADAVAAGCRDCRIIRFSNAGHMPHREEPEKCASLIREFINSHPINIAAEN